MPTTDLDGRVRPQTLFIEIAINRCPHTQSFIILGGFNLVTDGTYNDIDGLIHNGTQIASFLLLRDDVPGMDVTNAGTRAVAVHIGKDIHNLVRRDTDATLLRIHPVERIRNGLAQRRNVLFRKKGFHATILRRRVFPPNKRIVRIIVGRGVVVADLCPRR